MSLDIGLGSPKDMDKTGSYIRLNGIRTTWESFQRLSGAPQHPIVPANTKQAARPLERQ